MTQATLAFPETTKIATHLVAIMSGRWLPAHRIREELVARGYPYPSESALTARIRELRGLGHNVPCRKHGRQWEYSVVQG